MKINRSRNKSTRKKVIAWLMLLVFLVNTFQPLTVFALTGGPSQPEVEGFTPVGTSDMVDLFSGDFNYNIPLMDVDGYPLNISYHSGITMDQEASWVGLGWNINPGVINRNVRGIPDDFDGDVVTKKFSMRDNKTYGVNFGLGVEFAGFATIGLDYSLGIKYNNYNGIGAEQSVCLTISPGKEGKGPLTGSLGLTSSSDEGVTIAPSVSFSLTVDKSFNSSTKLGISVGSSFNTREGLKTLTINASIQQKRQWFSGSGDNVKLKRGENGGSVGGASFNFGQPTYTPKVDMPMRNLAMTGRFSVGGEVLPAFAHAFVGGYYSKQSLARNESSNPAYGYLNSEAGAPLDNALMDFNREKDGGFTESTPSLPLPIQTFDVYSVSGQGIGGSYRPYRSDIGYVFDPTCNLSSDNGSIGIELGVGNLAHDGGDLNVTDVSSRSGKWTSDNFAIQRLNYPSSGDPLYEKVYFKEANEKSVDADPEFYKKMGGFSARAIQMRHAARFYTVADERYDSGQPIVSSNYRANREHRNQEISFLTRAEEEKFGVDTASSLNLYSAAPKHHIGEITTYSTDGKRYVYGIAAYNKVQHEVTFAVEDNIDAANGLVGYSSGQNSASNRKGVDWFYNEVITPAYAHSYLLTAVLSPDYIDADTIKGPSDGDLGNYTKFHYIKNDNYKWRVPVESYKANYNEGLKSKIGATGDDKGNYLYGEKELYFVDRIETKNYVAIFTLEDRADAKGVQGENGGMEPSSYTKLLRKISLYSKPDYNQNYASGTAIPIKEVHFVYDYSLCRGVKNFCQSCSHTDPIVLEDISATTDGGKLTLRKIFFTYQRSNRGRLSPYQFNYTTANPPYHSKHYDRWGNYKDDSVLPSGLEISDFPYVYQDKTDADENSSAWTLNQIQLPSGGTINVQFESDDYAYVQNKPAGQMFLITGSDHVNGDVLSDPDGQTNPKFIFDFQRREDGSYDNNVSHYCKPNDLIYFRFLVKITASESEFISGYARISNVGIESSTSGWVTFNGVDLNSNSSGIYCPIAKAALQFARCNTPKLLWTSPPVGNDPSFGLPLIKALVQSFSTLGELINGPNGNAFKHHCHNFVPNQSWIRLNNPIHKKYGGGCRVKQIDMNDEWSTMTDAEESSASYGQVYDYTYPDGTSTGVAAYEPQLGGDENPWKMPVYFNEHKLLVQDETHYVEEPFGETYFPTASVGYSRVIVKNLQHAGLHRHATGKVVHEFYTARDFPTITDRTSINKLPLRDKTDKWSLLSIFHIDCRDYLTASQGYSVEVNDMHGKPKAEMVFQEGQDTSITSIQYIYKQQPYLSNAFRLTNDANVIFQDGTIAARNIGVNMDMVADFRENKTSTISGGVNVNLDGFTLILIPLVEIPGFWPAFAHDRVQFRSAVTTKLIQRFGLLDSTIAKDLGSTVVTKNLAYDAESGDVLLTQTRQDFNDPVYSFTFPAHWYYSGMAPVSRNQGAVVQQTITPDANGKFNFNNANRIFEEGDELAIYPGAFKAWVNQVTPTSVSIINVAGQPISSTITRIKILRSGHRNQQSLPMAQITTLVDPLQSLNSNSYAKVLQASAIEYGNNWKTFCDCFEPDTTIHSPYSPTTNPYILGTKGYWKPKKSYLYLTDRTQTKYDNNSNIRKDGIFAAFTPFYKLSGGNWVMDDLNWTYTSQVTQFSPFGPEIENKDALGKYSAATFGFNQSLATAVSANARYRDIGFDSFEDYGFSECADNHFKVTPHSDATSRLSNEFHSGRHSLRVSSSDSVFINKQLVDVCDAPPPCSVNLCYHTGDNTISIVLDSATGNPGGLSFEWQLTGGNSEKEVTLINDGIFIREFRGIETCSLNLVITFSNGCVVRKLIILHHDSAGNIWSVEGITECPGI